MFHHVDGMVTRASSMRWAVNVVSILEKRRECVGNIITCTGF